MQRLASDSPVQVFQCGGVLTYQLLCGRDVAKEDMHAVQSANYCYLVVNTHDRTGIAVDAAWDIDGIYDQAKQLGVKVKGCVYSHFHVDHCGGKTGPFESMMGRKELPGAKEVHQQGGKIWAGAGDVDRIREQCSVEDVVGLNDGDMIDCGDLVLHIVHTPGHSPGSICIYAAPRCLSARGDMADSPLNEKLIKADGGLLFTGDTLFVGSCGRTDRPDAGMDPAKMATSLSRLGTLDPSVIVLPGHNYASVPFTTIGDERARNESVQYSMLEVPKPTPLPPCFLCNSGSNCGPRGFKIGRKLRIAGLQSEAGKALNGQEGVLQGFNSEKGRYLVCLPCGSEMKVLKPENLESTAVATGAGVDAEANTPAEQKPAQLEQERNREEQGTMKLKSEMQQAEAQKAEEAAVEQMSAHAVTGDAISAFFDGAASVECRDGWARPWRLCHDRLDLYGERLSAMAACAAVRLVFCTSGSYLRLLASAEKPENVDRDYLGQIDGYPLEYELFVNGSFFRKQMIDTTKSREHTVIFDGLPEGIKKLELWLPCNSAIAVHAVDTGEAIERSLEMDARPLWICYGSSITHGGTVSSTPSGCWAGTCSQLAKVRLMNLGFGGECYLDQSVARVIRDTKCDCITLKLGINICTALALTARTFPAAVIGFIQTIRDGHPDTPLVIVSPIFCSMAEDEAPVKASAFLSLKQMRSCLEAAVTKLRAAGDKCLFYRDGLELLGAANKLMLYDKIHPTAQGNLLMGQRFAALEFGPTGRLLPGRVPDLEQMLKQPDSNLKLAAGIAPGDVAGAYICQTPDGGRSRMLVRLEARGLVAVSDRKDWPPALMDLREDLVFLRGHWGVWARVTKSAIEFNNGIVWAPPGGGSPSIPKAFLKKS